MSCGSIDDNKVFGFLDAQFAFCPGEAHAHSFRLGEALGLGRTPVVTPELLHHPLVFRI